MEERYEWGELLEISKKNMFHLKIMNTSWKKKHSYVEETKYVTNHETDFLMSEEIIINK